MGGERIAKTPTSSLTASELLVNKLRYRSVAKIKGLLRRGTPETPTVRWSPITKLSQELVEIIVSYFIYDTPTLLACSSTCYSWYIAAIPHLHHSLTAGKDIPYDKNFWPKPLRRSYKLGLLPFAKRFQIRLSSPRHSSPKVTPEWFDRRTLRYFSALANLQELGIDRLHVSSFIPTIHQCFGHFSPTLRFLSLKDPTGSCRQILYFISLFPNLQDLKLHFFFPEDEQENASDAALVPFSIPPLRGRLMLTCFARENLVKEMITHFGGLRFRYMDLLMVKGLPFLLGACAETLETLRLYPDDPYTDNQAPVLQHFNLSRNGSLRTLEIMAESISAVEDTASNFLGTVLSTVTSPTPLDVVIIYQDVDLGGARGCWLGCNSGPACPRHDSREGRDDDTMRYKQQFRVFREMHNARDFHLVLCADVSDSIVERAMQTLERFVDAREVNGGLDYLLYKPLVMFERRTLHIHREDRTSTFSDV